MLDKSVHCHYLLSYPVGSEIPIHFFSSPDHTFVHIVEDLVDFALTKIDQPLSFIPETPIVTPPTSTYSRHDNSDSEEVGSNSEDSDDELDDFGDNNENILEGNYQPANNQT
jgi:hypothetical protein